MRRFTITTDPHPKIGDNQVDRNVWEGTTKITQRFLKRLCAENKEFANHPELTVVRLKAGTRLRIQVQGTTFDLLPEAFGLVAKKLHVNDRITLDLTSWIGKKKTVFGITITSSWLRHHKVRWSEPGIWGNEYILVGGTSPVTGYEGALSTGHLKAIAKMVSAASERKRRLVPKWKVKDSKGTWFLTVGEHYFNWDLVKLFYENAAGPISFAKASPKGLSFGVFENNTPVGLIAPLSSYRRPEEAGRTPFVAPKPRKKSALTNLLTAAQKGLAKATVAQKAADQKAV